MPDSVPKQLLDLEDLTLHEGAPVLLRRALAPLAEGEWLGVRQNTKRIISQGRLRLLDACHSRWV